MAKLVTISIVAPGNPNAREVSAGTDPLDWMIERWAQKLDQVTADKPDLIVLPENCDEIRGLDDDAQAAYDSGRQERMDSFISEQAKARSCYITYPGVRSAPDGSWRNSICLYDRQGEVAGIYNKNHVVINETTDKGILCGKSPTIIETDFGRVGCAICFDLNFDPLRTQYMALKPDLLLFSSLYHGALMQAYWAYSCRSYFVGAISGLPSSIISPVGETVAKTTNYFDYVTAEVNLDCALAHLDYHWEKLDKLRETYGRDVVVHDPGFLGSVLVTSGREEISAREMLDAFEIEHLDDYFARSLAHHAAPENREA